MSKKAALAPVVVPKETLPDDQSGPEPTGQPIPFKAPPGPLPKEAGAPTTIQDCVDNGGHGGPDGTRWYYAGHPQRTADNKGNITGYDPVGKLRNDTRICEICGTVGI